MTLGPKKRRRRKLIIIMSRAENDVVLRCLCEVYEIYDKGHTNQLSLAEAAVTDEIDAVYAQYDPLDDPDFDACAAESIDPDTDSLTLALETWRGE